MPTDPREITIRVISYKEVQVLCGGVWKTIRKHDKGFDDIYRLSFRAEIAHGIACSGD